MESKCLQSFCQYVQNIEHSADYIYCFRGQANKNWPVLPSLYRPKNIRIKENKDAIYKEIKRLYPKEFSNGKFFSINDIAKLQHYSIPTSLLDVSLNPFVSLYFATEAVSNKTGIVYFYKIPKTNLKIDFEIDENDLIASKEIILIEPSLENNQRIKNQNGAFLYSSSEFWKIPDEWIIAKIEIHNCSKEKIRNELRNMNISETTILPEFSEYYKELNTRYKNHAKS